MTAYSPAGLTVYLNGDFVPAETAGVSVFDHGLLYGDGAFEGIRLYSGAIFRPADHLARLRKSLRALAISQVHNEEALLSITTDVVRRSQLNDAHIRIVVTRGFGSPGLDPWRCPEPTVLVMAYPFPPMLGTDGIKLITSPVVRKAPRSLGSQVKSLNYLDCIVAKQHARAAGCDDAVMLDHIGAVAECTSTNLFAVFDGTLTTPTTRAALAGITRLTVLERAQMLGLPIAVRDIWPAELHAADAIFVTGSGAGIVPVAQVDGHRIATEDEPMVRKLAEAYHEATRDESLIVRV